MYIMIEGGEGAGKTTIAKKLMEHYKSLGKDVLLVREIGSCESAEDLRGIIYNHKDLEPMSQFLIFLAARIELYQKRILPHLKKGGVVISDRGIWSSLVYQGFCMGLDIDKLFTLNIENVSIPDISIFIMVSPEIGLKRELIENPFGELEFHKKVYDGYEYLSSKYHGIEKIYSDEITIDTLFSEVKHVLGC